MCKDKAGSAGWLLSRGKNRDDPAELLEIQAPGDSTGAEEPLVGPPTQDLPHLWSHILPKQRDNEENKKVIKVLIASPYFSQPSA